jgi:hypothetical protein
MGPNFNCEERLRKTCRRSLTPWRHFGSRSFGTRGHVVPRLRAKLAGAFEVSIARLIQRHHIRSIERHQWSAGARDVDVQVQLGLPLFVEHFEKILA